MPDEDAREYGVPRALLIRKLVVIEDCVTDMRRLLGMPVSPAQALRMAVDEYATNRERMPAKRVVPANWTRGSIDASIETKSANGDRVIRRRKRRKSAKAGKVK
jgi:hypothetical protein